VKKKVVSKRKTNNKIPNTGAIAGLVTIKPRGRKTKGEFLKTCEWKGTNAQQINNPI
jgi:hypothetical protein